jgi:hypothetical protein
VTDIHIPAGSTLREAFLKLAEGKSPAEAHDVFTTAGMAIARDLRATGQISQAAVPYIASRFARSLEATFRATRAADDENGRPGPSTAPTEESS